MDKRLQGKTIFITGASSGIGKSTAFEFARSVPSGLKLVLTARRIDTLKEIAADLTAQFPKTQVLPVQLDVSDPVAVKGFVDTLPAEFQEIDALINNAYVPSSSTSDSVYLLTFGVEDSSVASTRPPPSRRTTSISCSRPTCTASST